MKINMNKRLKITLQNLQTLEKNCRDSKKGFVPSPVVCMYMIECILPVVDIYPVKFLRQFSVETAFETSEELMEFLDETIGRLKRAEYYAFSQEELEDLNELYSSNTFEFICKPTFNPQGQLEMFLRDLLNRLTTINDLITDPRRNQAKLSYINRTVTTPINQIASILEVICAGIATNV